MTNFAYTVNWEEEAEPKGSIFWTVIFAAAFGALAWFMYQLLGEGFGTDGAARMQSYVELSRGEEDFLAQNFARIYPIIPFIMGLVFANAPQIADAAPYYVDCFAAATLIGVGFYRLSKSGHNPLIALVLVALIAANPVFLFVATSGSGVAVALLFVYMFAAGAISLGRDASVRGLIMIAVAYAGLLLTTPLGFYFLTISMPLLALASRHDFVAQAPLSFFLVLGFVPLAIIASLMFMNWVFVGDVAGLLRSLTGGVTAARAEMGLEPWPFMMGGRPFAAMGVMLTGLLFATPLTLLALTGVFAGSIMRRTTLVIFGSVILTGAVTTYLGVLSHPAYLWVFTVPLSLVVLEEITGGILGRAWAVLALLAGIAGGWWLLGVHPTGDLNFWRAEVGGSIEEVTGMELNVPQGVASIARREAALNRIEEEAVQVWGARSDILSAAEID